MIPLSLLQEEAALQEALRMSMETSAAQPSEAIETPSFLDAEFVKQLLGGVDVDPNDPMVQAALAQMSADREDEEGKDPKRMKKDDEQKGDK